MNRREIPDLSQLPEIMTLEYVAGVTGWSVRAIYRRMKAGAIGYVVDGRSRWITRDQVIEYFASCRKDAIPAPSLELGSNVVRFAAHKPKKSGKVDKETVRAELAM